MTSTDLNIRRIDGRRDDIRAAMAELRAPAQPGGQRRQRGRPAADHRGFRRAAVAQSGGRADLRRRGREGRRGRAGLFGPHRQGPAHAPRRSACRRRNWPRPTPRPIRELLAAVRRIAANIREFQQAILHHDVRLERPGGYLVAALSAAGSGGDLRARRSGRLSVDRADDGRAGPGGGREASWPWSPRPRGSAPTIADLLATCHELGISEVYRLGGAQAVAALAYGVEGIPRVDKIVGPGQPVRGPGQEARLRRRWTSTRSPAPARWW